MKKSENKIKKEKKDKRQIITRISNKIGFINNRYIYSFATCL